MSKHLSFNRASNRNVTVTPPGSASKQVVHLEYPDKVRTRLLNLLDSVTQSDLELSS